MNRIAQLRKEKHLNQTGLAMRLNISQYLVSAYETGRHQPSVELLMQMSDLFNVSVDYIIGNSDIRIPTDLLKKSNISEDEAELLALFRNLSKKNQQRAIGVLMSFDENIK